MQIFELTINDVEVYKEDIINMLRQSFEKSFPKVNSELISFNDRVESLKTYLNEKKAIVYGIKAGLNLVGFIWFFEKSTIDGKVIHINHFVVDENYRCQGMGSNLWNIVEGYAGKRGIEEIELLVTKDNENAVNFYLNKKFEVERLVMKKRLLN